MARHVTRCLCILLPPEKRSRPRHPRALPWQTRLASASRQQCVKPGAEISSSCTAVFVERLVVLRGPIRFRRQTPNHQRHVGRTKSVGVRHPRFGAQLVGTSLPGLSDGIHVGMPPRVGDRVTEELLRRNLPQPFDHLSDEVADGVEPDDAPGLL